RLPGGGAPGRGAGPVRDAPRVVPRLPHLPRTDTDDDRARRPAHAAGPRARSGGDAAERLPRLEIGLTPRTLPRVRLFAFVRHAQSLLNLERRINGDPSLDVPLTEQGEAEARALGAQLAHVPL